MTPHWLRFAYVVELLLAVPAIFTLWSQVGGQGHLDLMPWYLKLLLGGAMSIACVLATAAIVERERFANGRFLAWAGALILIGVVMGAVTYYYHLHESYDDTDEEQSTNAALRFEVERHA